MRFADPPQVGYVLKRYPRYSETFIINEIRAHEAAGWQVDVFSLRPATDTFFHEQVDRVQASVTYLPAQGITAGHLWSAMEAAHAAFGGLDDVWDAGRSSEAPINDLVQAIVLAVEVRRRGLRHLHAHFASAAATVARIAARVAGISYSLTAHAKDIFHESVRHDDLQTKLGDAAAVVTVSDYNRDFLTRTLALSAQKVHRIYNGIALDQFPFRDPMERPPRIVAVGRLVEKKGFADLIEACRMLAATHRSWSCEIIGGGDQEPYLREQIQRVGLGDRIILRGPQPTSEVIRAIQSAAVLAAPCVVGCDGNRDGLPTVLLEAMALGTPCVATDVTGIPEVLHDGETGLAVPQHDPPALAAAIARLLDDGPLRANLARRARRHIEQQFNVHCNTARLRALFHSCCETITTPRRTWQEAV